MKKSVVVIRIEPRPDAAVSATWGGIMLLTALPIPFLSLPWWGTALLASAWMGIWRREHRIQLSHRHRLSVSRLTLAPGGDCLLDFARGPRKQRAVITARLITSSWVLLRLRGPRRNATLLLTRAQVQPRVWRGLQTWLRWQPGKGATAGSPGR